MENTKPRNFCSKDDLLMLNIPLFIAMHLFGQAVLVGKRSHMITSNLQTEKKGPASLLNGVSRVLEARNEHSSQTVQTSISGLSKHRCTHRHTQAPHKQCACVTEAMPTRHTYAQHTCVYIHTQWTITIYTSVASSKYSGIISLRNELIKGDNKEAKKAIELQILQCLPSSPQSYCHFRLKYISRWNNWQLLFLKK